MHTSDALSRLQNIADTPDNKDIIPLNKSYQISKDMDIETMPHAMYFTGNSDTVSKINQVPYQTI